MGRLRRTLPARTANRGRCSHDPAAGYGGRPARGTFPPGDALTLSLPVSSASQATISVLLPDLGESVTEGVVVEWRKSEGDLVEAGETLLDVTTDKVDVEIPAPSAGWLARQVAQPGDVVAVGALLGEIEKDPVGGGGAE